MYCEYVCGHRTMQRAHKFIFMYYNARCCLFQLDEDADPYLFPLFTYLFYALRKLNVRPFIHHPISMLFIAFYWALLRYTSPLLLLQQCCQKSKTKVWLIYSFPIAIAVILQPQIILLRNIKIEKQIKTATPRTFWPQCTRKKCNCINNDIESSNAVDKHVCMNLIGQHDPNFISKLGKIPRSLRSRFIAHNEKVICILCMLMECVFDTVKTCD